MFEILYFFFSFVLFPLLVYCAAVRLAYFSLGMRNIEMGNKHRRPSLSLCARLRKAFATVFSSLLCVPCIVKINKKILWASETATGMWGEGAQNSRAEKKKRTEKQRSKKSD